MIFAFSHDWILNQIFRFQLFLGVSKRESECVSVSACVCVCVTYVFSHCTLYTVQWDFPATFELVNILFSNYMAQRYHYGGIGQVFTQVIVIRKEFVKSQYPKYIIMEE